jgi:hypothetical protein
LFPLPAPVVAKLRLVQMPPTATAVALTPPRGGVPASRTRMRPACSAGSLSTVEEEGDDGRTSSLGDAAAAPSTGAAAAAVSGGQLTLTLCPGCAASLRAHAPAALDALASWSSASASPPASPPRSQAAPGAAGGAAPCTCGVSLRATTMPAGVRRQLSATPLSRSLHSEAGQLAMQRHADAAWPGVGGMAGERPRQLFPSSFLHHHHHHQHQQEQRGGGRFDRPTYVVAWERRQTDTLPDCRVPAALVALARYVNPF